VAPAIFVRIARRDKNPVALAQSSRKLIKKLIIENVDCEAPAASV
jgi:hypothetical protein